MTRAGTRNKKLAEKIAELRLQGYSYREISYELDITIDSACRYFNQEMGLLQKEAHETAWEARQLDLQRTDRIIKANINALSHKLTDDAGDTVTDENGQAVVVPNARAADTLLKALNHRARLLGLYAEEPAPMDELQQKVDALLEKDVSSMTDEELDEFFQKHWESQKKDK